MPLVNSIYNKFETTFFLGPKVWDIRLLEIKGKEKLEAFKYPLQNWKPGNCPCRLRKHIAGGSFI